MTGKNCWQKAPARRVSFVIDGADYFAALRAALLRAQRQVWLIGWEMHSQIRLLGEEAVDGRPRELAPFLASLAEERPELRIYLLCWDAPLVYGYDREASPTRRWRVHPRLAFHLDGNHPIGASHHQKIAVIDDAVAFVGGLDLTVKRWDTKEHLAEDPKRIGPDGKPYSPFHDVMIAVDETAARRLGDLARERWYRATGERIGASPGTSDTWPPNLEPDVWDAPSVVIARSEPAWDGREAVNEVGALYDDSIASARRSIYIENQYFTCGRICERLAARLEEPDGPEVVIVAPCACSGWLEEATMGLQRAQMIEHLRKADRFGRFRIYYPVIPGLEGRFSVHSKVMIVDDRSARVGSSNLANRSMTLDTECDVAIESVGEPRIEKAIASFQNRLLAEHLGTEPETVGDAISRHDGSLIRAIESLRGNPRRLDPLDGESDTWLRSEPPAKQDAGQIEAFRSVPLRLLPRVILRAVANVIPVPGWSP